MILGFLVGQNVEPIEKLKIVKEFVTDTVYRSKVIKVPVEIEVMVPEVNNVKEKDTVETIVEVEKLDSVIVVDSTEQDDLLQIVKDEKLKSETLKLVIINKEPIDTLLQKLLDVKPVVQKQIIVEYWESPINYKGYKLSKSKLIIYGIKPLMESAIYKNESVYYFRANNLYYQLVESSDFKAISSISKPDFIND